VGRSRFYHFRVFSVSPAEIATIAVVALLVFGPHRLPDIAKRAGRLGRELSRAAHELKSGIERELDEASAPLDEVRRKLGSTLTPPDDSDKPVNRGGPADPTEAAAEPAETSSADADLDS
jgi:sec-independent protein translocase protein TatB